MRSNRIIHLSIFFAYFLTGMIALVIGAILPYLIKEFHLGYSQGGMLLFVHAAGNLGSAVISGIISTFLGRKFALILGGVFFSIALTGIIFAPSFLLLLLFMLLSGFGRGTFVNLGNATMNEATEGSGSAINLLHTFFAIGAFIAPLMVGIAIKANLGWRFAVVIVAALSFILLVVLVLMPYKVKKGVEGIPIEKEKRSFEFLKNKRYYLFMGILFFYVGTEISMNGWIVTYLTNSKELPVILSQSVLSVLWLAIIFGRLLCAYISTKLSKEKIILFSSLGAALFFLFLLVSASPFTIMFCAFGMGVFLAGIYPTTVANANFLTNGSSISNGMLVSCGSLGASAIPFITGVLAGEKGIGIGMFTILCTAFLLVIFALLNALSTSETGRSTIQVKQKVRFGG